MLAELAKGRLREDLRSRFHTEEAVHKVPTAEVLREEVKLSEALIAKAQPWGEDVERGVRLLESILHPGGEGKVVSVVDPEARFGHKSPQKTFVGYKVHVAEDSSELVTSLEVLGGNEHEGHHLPEFLAVNPGSDVQAPPFSVTHDLLLV